MIIISLMGGLGNQMFQYSFGRNLSLVKNLNLKLDLTNFTWTNTRPYFLNCFNIREDFATSEEVEYYKKNHLIQERFFEYDETISNQFSTDAMFLGYWQSEKYFKDIEIIIRKEFTLKNTITRNIDIYHDILRNEDSVSLHYRRGDYSKPPHNDLHEICNFNYYQEACKYMISKKKLKKPIFYVFSDDIDYFRDNFKTNYELRFVTSNLEQDKDGRVQDKKCFEDMYLISQCRHHIIANSSFSWWGAWLSQNRNKMIISPKKWFKKEMNIEDLIPEKWIKI